jgi:hypothetical protein
MSGNEAKDRSMFNALVDTRLSARVGEPDEAARSRISDQLNEALRSTLGDLLGEGPIDVDTVDRVAPWARDLARGLHWQALHSRTTEAKFDSRDVIDELAEADLAPALRDDGAATVAITWALTHDRIVDQIHGHQAHKRYSSRAPWEGSVVLGYGIHLILEWLRLDPRLDPMEP